MSFSCATPGFLYAVFLYGWYLVQSPNDTKTKKNVIMLCIGIANNRFVQMFVKPILLSMILNKSWTK